LPESSYVDVHDVRQQGGTDGPVRGGEHASQRGGDAMCGPEAGIGEGQAAEQTGQRHILPRSGVVAMLAGSLQRTGGPHYPLAAQPVGDRVAADGHERLNELRQGIHAGRGGERAGQFVSQLRVDDRQARKQHRTAQADVSSLAVPAVVGIAIIGSGGISLLKRPS